MARADGLDDRSVDIRGLLPVGHANARETGNRLLAGLPRKDLRRFLDRCEEVKVSISEILFEPGQPIRHAYFPTDSFISLVIPADGHANLEVDLIGNEGMVGLPLVLGDGQSPLRAQVQCTGASLRITAAALRAELNAGTALKKTLNRYACLSLAQFAQMAACNRFHDIDARLAHWLLMTSDRARSDAFHMTHEVLGQMLGVRR
ncbi:MAG: Crp/Fnr family transcriptional regulator, partial [Betaproteobacteria bacterium]